MRRWVAAVAVAGLLATALSACGADGTGDKGYVAGDGVIRQFKVSERKPVGAVSGRTLDAVRESVSGLAKRSGAGAARPVVVNVWASWCAPCRAEAPVLKKAAEQLGSTAAFLGINVRDPGGVDTSKAFERRFAVPYPSLYDPSGETLLAFPGRFSPTAIPSTIVIDSKGRVAATVLGEVPSATTLVELVKDAG